MSLKNLQTAEKQRGKILKPLDLEDWEKTFKKADGHFCTNIRYIRFHEKLIAPKFGKSFPKGNSA